MANPVEYDHRRTPLRPSTNIPVSTRGHRPPVKQHHRASVATARRVPRYSHRPLATAPRSGLFIIYRAFASRRRECRLASTTSVRARPLSYRFTDGRVSARPSGSPRPELRRERSLSHTLCVMPRSLVHHHDRCTECTLHGGEWPCQWQTVAIIPCSRKSNPDPAFRGLVRWWRPYAIFGPAGDGGYVTFSLLWSRTLLSLLPHSYRFTPGSCRYPFRPENPLVRSTSSP